MCGLQSHVVMLFEEDGAIAEPIALLPPRCRESNAPAFSAFTEAVSSSLRFTPLALKSLSQTAKPSPVQPLHFQHVSSVQLAARQHKRSVGLRCSTRIAEHRTAGSPLYLFPSSAFCTLQPCSHCRGDVKHFRLTRGR